LVHPSVTVVIFVCSTVTFHWLGPSNLWKIQKER
jgi:hypothetical protein